MCIQTTLTGSSKLKKMKIIRSEVVEGDVLEELKWNVKGVNVIHA